MTERQSHRTLVNPSDPSLEKSADENEISVSHREVAALREVLLLQTQLETARTQLASSQAALAKVSSDLAKLSEELVTSRATIVTISRSRSWRWLEPIRRLNALIRSYRSRIRLRRFF